MISNSRPTAVAGSFYPASADELSALLDDCFNSSPLGPAGIFQPDPSIIAGMVPHASPIYSGPCAAHLYCRLDTAVKRVLLVGVNHRARGHKAALSPWSGWHSPLGEVVVDDTLSDFLQARVGFLKRDAAGHADEHSIEVQLPFLRCVLSEFAFVPISLSYLSVEECAELGAAIAEACRAEASSGTKTLILASSDLSHYLSPKRTEELDRKALEPVLNLDPESLLRVVERENITMCGVLPTAVVLFAAKALGAHRARLLKHCHSGDVAPMRRVVGYASVAIE